MMTPMNTLRAILTGALVWLFIFCSFAILGSMPSLKDEMNIQLLVVGILIVPYAKLGASIFYKNGNKKNGLILGIIMALTALILDALITVPFVEIPKGGTYKSFFFFPFLWVFVLINISTVYLYWKLKIRTVKIN